MQEYPSRCIVRDVYEPRDLKPCPRCGRKPRLVGRYYYPDAQYEYQYQCRRWLGFRLCHAGGKPARIDKDWGDLGVRTASERWNESVDAAMAHQ